MAGYSIPAGIGMKFVGAFVIVSASWVAKGGGSKIERRMERRSMMTFPGSCQFFISCLTRANSLIVEWGRMVLYTYSRKFAMSYTQCLFVNRIRCEFKVSSLFHAAGVDQLPHPEGRVNQLQIFHVTHTLFGSHECVNICMYQT